MQRIYYIILSTMLLFLYTSCSEDTYSDSNQDKSVSIKLFTQKNQTTKLVDEDNLQIEQTVKNLSIFFTEPSSNAITNKYVYSGFSSVDDYKLITLPIDPATLQSKDIYIVANYDNQSTLEAVSTIDDLKLLTTPAVNKNNILNPANGFCMYGVTSNFNFNDGTNSPAIVNMVRTCAKLRISVTFPESATLSTNNSFFVAYAASYTYIIKNLGVALPFDDYFTYAAPIPFENNGTQPYVNTTYIYESSQIPILYIHTHIDNSTNFQEFSTDLPKPQRNYLYDISIQIYKGTVPSGTKSLLNSDSAYSLRSVIKVYDENGHLVE